MRERDLDFFYSFAGFSLSENGFTDRNGCIDEAAAVTFLDDS